MTPASSMLIIPMATSHFREDYKKIVNNSLPALIEDLFKYLTIN